MSTFVIRLDGADITDDVITADAEFTQQANGQPGSARFRIRDLAHTYGPTPGQTLTLDVDGERVWGGWAMRVSPGYFFAVDDTTDAQETERLWLIEGVDYNILFSKRFLINKANPTQMLKNYPAGTPDDQIVLDVVSKYLELAGDGISTAGVTHVGTPNPDDPGNIGNPGASWGAAMSIIAAPTQAVFYIGPDKVLYYVDVETVTAPFMLSDAPVVVQEVGFRDMEINFDGTKLVNDALVWGAGAHATPDITFKRVHDQDSIDEHGRWQLGEFTTALFTDAGVNQRAQSYVYGSPQSKRGGKDDSVQVMCTIFTPGLTAGMVVAFASNVFNYEDVLPIRRMGIRFPTPTDVEFKLYLSWDVDAPWADYEFWFPKVNFDYPNPPVIDYPHIWDHVLPPTTGECDDSVCGITDSFSRTIPANNTSIGVSDAGIPWDVFDGGVGATVEVDPTDGLIINVPAAETFGTEVVLEPMNVPLGTPAGIVYIEFELMFTDFTIFNPITFDGTERFDINTAFIFARFNPGVAPGDSNSIQFSHGVDDVFAAFLWEEDVTYTVRISYGTPSPTLSSIGLNIFKDGVSVVDLDLTDIDLSLGPLDSFSMSMQNEQASGPFQAQIDQLNIYSPTSDSQDLNLNGCSAPQVDDFNRPGNTVGDGWGSSTPSGYVWDTTGQAYLEGTAGILYPADSASTPVHSVASILSTGPWEGVSTLLIQFSFGDVPAGSSPESGYLISIADTAGLYSAVVAISPSATAGEVTLYSGVGGVVVGTNAVQYSRSWSAGPVYMMRWEHNRPGTGTDRVRIWGDGESEPSTWNLELGSTSAPAFSGSLTGPFLSFDDFTLAAHRPQFWAVYSIDIDYDGRPCSYDCSDFEVFDDFQRVVADGLGVATPSGAVWTNEDPSNVQISVDSGFAYWDFPEATTDLAPFPGMTTDTGPWSNPFTLRARFRVNLKDRVLLAPYFEVSDSISGAFCEAFVEPWRDNIGMQNDDGVSLNYEGDAPLTIVDGVWYLMEWENPLAGGSAVTRLRVWPETETPPDWMVEISGIAITPDTLTTNAQGGFHASGGTAGFILNSIDFNPCVPVTATTGPSVSGTRCESFNGGGTTFTMAGPFQAQTTKAYIDGVLQRNALDYSEVDPVGGVVMFGQATPLGSIVTVCYTASVGGS